MKPVRQIAKRLHQYRCGGYIPMAYYDYYHIYVYIYDIADLSIYDFHDLGKPLTI